jgi:hypothetical protein
MLLYEDKSRMALGGRFSFIKGVEKDLFISPETKWLM